MNMKNIAIAAIVLVTGIFGYAYFTTPKTYEDCILKEIGDTQSTQAAKYVRAACAKKFPTQKKTGEGPYLTDEQVFGD